MVYRARSLCLLLLVALLLFVSACSGRRGQTVEDIPTPASFEGLATAQYLTQVAPPEGFRESVAFPEIDANLNLLAGGRYTVYLDFQGVFSRTPRPTNAAAAAEVWFTRSDHRAASSPRSPARCSAAKTTASRPSASAPIPSWCRTENA